MRYQVTTVETYCSVYCHARAASELVYRATSPWHELVGHHPGAAWYVAEDHLSGFGVAPDGTLLGVFSLVRGRGRELLEAAIWRGAESLWCFDGYLTELYGRHGFAEVSREPNWTRGQPDVVHMQLAQAAA